MQIFLETDRLVLRQFTEDDVDNLVELDSDPEVMHFINGGRATPRDEVERDVLPAFLDYYERFAGYGFWAAIEKSPVDSWVVPFSASKAAPRTKSSSATGCADRRGERVMRPKARGR